MALPPKQNRGFRTLSPERLLEVARKGGASVKNENRSFSKNRELAREAGRKGGVNSKGGGRRKKPAEQET